MGTPAPDSNVLGIDLLVVLMLAVVSLHAVRHRQLGLFVASCLLGCGTEFMAIRFGGTHCHNAGIINFAQCSSVNSVVYYGPWIYSSVASALKLVGDGSRWPLPWLCGAFAFGMCGIYEMQGPNMRWWRWPDPATGHVVDFAGEPFWQLEPTGDSMVITAHAGAALKERVWALSDPTWPRALPVMAPYFDMAFGWGVGLVLWAAPGLGTVVCVLLGPLAALLWDLPVRLLQEQCGVDKTESVPMLMATAVILPLLLMRGGLRRQPSTTQPDWLLALQHPRRKRCVLCAQRCRDQSFRGAAVTEAACPRCRDTFDPGSCDGNWHHREGAGCICFSHRQAHLAAGCRHRPLFPGPFAERRAQQRAGARQHITRILLRSFHGADSSGCCPVPVCASRGALARLPPCRSPLTGPAFSCRSSLTLAAGST